MGPRAAGPRIRHFAASLHAVARPLPPARSVPVRGPFVADGGCRGHRLGRAMMRRAQKPSLHMAIRGPDRRQAFRGCTRLRRNHRVMGVSVVGMPRNRCGRKARRCQYQTTKCNSAHVLASSMSPATGCDGRPTIRRVQGQSPDRPKTGGAPQFHRGCGNTCGRTTPAAGLPGPS